MNSRRASTIICSVFIGLVHYNLFADGATGEVIDPAMGGTRLSIVVTGMSSSTAPLYWRIYASDSDLPGFTSNGTPFRAGVLRRFDQLAQIEVGAVPVGAYFAIVAQDLDGDTDIAVFSEPRGYSGYDGCLVPDWDQGARAVEGERASIEVVMRCNTP